MSNMKYYAGIGSRDTPIPVLSNMSDLARKLHVLDWTLRSGGAQGADQAFESGVYANKQIFRPADCTQAAMDLSSEYHPNWPACSPYVRKLHGRNAQILLGGNLDTPVKCVVCWTSDGKATGGTGQAIRMAEAYQIPVFNLYRIDYRNDGDFLLDTITNLS